MSPPFPQLPLRSPRPEGGALRRDSFKGLLFRGQTGREPPAARQGKLDSKEASDSDRASKKERAKRKKEQVLPGAAVGVGERN